MNAAGFALLISAAAVSVVVYLLRYDQLWLWYKAVSYTHLTLPTIA